MDRRKTACVVLLVLLYIVLAFPPPAGAASLEEKKHDEGFHFYIAVGGCVAAGVYLFISYSTGLVDYDPMERSALVNYGREGWKAGLPMVHTIDRGASAGEYYLEVLTVRFE